MTLRAFVARAPLLPGYLRYGAISAVALGVDLVIFLGLITTAMAPTTASGFSYSAGIAAHWLFSSRLVFAARLADRGVRRARQQVLFLGSAIAGLVLTMAIVGLGQQLGIDPRLAKLVAVAVSFNVTYLLRRAVVFT